MSYSIGQLPLPVNNCVEFQALEKCFMISFPIKQLVELLFCDNKYLLTRVFSTWDRMFKFKAITCNCNASTTIFFASRVQLASSEHLRKQKFKVMQSLKDSLIVFHFHSASLSFLNLQYSSLNRITCRGLPYSTLFFRTFYKFIFY